MIRATPLLTRADVRVGGMWQVERGRYRAFCIRCGIERQTRTGRSRMCRDCLYADPALRRLTSRHRRDMDLTPYVFIDTETADLEPDNYPWEIALISQSHYEAGTWGEWVIQVSDFAHPVDPRAAAINGFADRWGNIDPLVVPVPLSLPTRAAVTMIENICRGKMLVASNPGFDESALRLLGCRTTWHHRKRDIPSMALGRLGYEPGGLDATAQALNVERRGDAHTALSDARLVRDCFTLILKEARYA